MTYSKISTVLLKNHYAMACQSGHGLHHQPRWIPIVDHLSECGKLWKHACTSYKQCSNTLYISIYHCIVHPEPKWHQFERLFKDETLDTSLLLYTLIGRVSNVLCVSGDTCPSTPTPRPGRILPCCSNFRLLSHPSTYSLTAVFACCAGRTWVVSLMTASHLDGEGI